MKHQWNVVRYMCTEYPETYKPYDGGTVDLEDEQHFDDDSLFATLKRSAHIVSDANREDFSFEGDNDSVFVMRWGQPWLLLQRDGRWG